MSLFQLRGSISSSTSLILGVLGLLIFILGWWALAEVFAVKVEDTGVPEESSAVMGNETEPAGLKLVDFDPAPDEIAEQAPEGTLIPVLVQAQGTDSSDQVVYSLLVDNSNGAIAVHPLTGRLQVIDGEKLNYELTTNLNLQVQARTADGREGTATFSLQITDVNEFPVGAISDVNPAPNEVRRGGRIGASVGITAFAEDSDGTDQVQYSLENGTDAAFSIHPTTGEVRLQDTTALQRLPEGQMRLGVVAQSEDGSSSRENFSLRILPPLTGNEAEKVSSKKVYPILPTPIRVVQSFPSLVQDDELIPNTLKSIWLNFKGYFWAVLISIPIGLVIGLFPLFRGLFSKQVNALRYLPLTALTGLFIIWFGIEDQMKVSFLAFGIIVYLLPVVVQRVDEVEKVYAQTVFTLGATKWQTIKSVFLPSVLSKLIDDIRVLTAISWTYIIIAELLNRQGGIGALIYIKARQGQIEKVFATLIVIILIGFVQDRIFVYLDKRLFPHKFYKSTLTGIREVEYGILALLVMVTLVIFQQIFLPALTGTFTNIALIVLISALIIMVYGELKVRESLKENA